MRGLVSLILLVVLAYLAGLGLFAMDLRRAPQKPARADAIVVLTGGELRLDRAVSLLEKGYGKRLLISGVDLSATKSDLKRLAKGGRKFDCCADLGFTAADTHGNAEETAEWSASHGYKSLIVVTANYHMRRTLAEFSAVMPDMALRPYPVTPEDVDFVHWWRDPATLKLLHGEYAKYLASLVVTRLRPLAS